MFNVKCEMCEEAQPWVIPSVEPPAVQGVPQVCY